MKDETTTRATTLAYFQRLFGGGVDERVSAVAGIEGWCLSYDSKDVPAIAGGLMVAFVAETEVDVRSRIVAAIFELGMVHQNIPRSVVAPMLGLEAEDFARGDSEIVEGIFEMTV